ncbi:MAG: hypothetical protein KatS3mg108_1461 [Isosphaeraceae bacterium]|jgi:hypothetical protein|nr:MAG: hypothetical protein KatS3mg108_1461 [Isosphaeraceae bacterium]
MPQIVDPLEGAELRRAIVGRDVRLVFTWLDDRWGHTLQFGTADPMILLASQEDTPADLPADAPTRPVYQQLHFQQADNGCLALLVGQAGHDHFSASIHFTEHDGGATSIDFDIAGRHTRRDMPASGLTTAYVVALSPSDVEEASHRVVRWASHNPRGHLMVGPVAAVDNPTIVLLGESGRRHSVLQVYSPPDPVAAALRCRYRWTWESPRPDPARPTS